MACKRSSVQVRYPPFAAKMRTKEQKPDNAEGVDRVGPLFLADVDGMVAWLGAPSS